MNVPDALKMLCDAESADRMRAIALANWRRLTVAARSRGDDVRAALLSQAKETLKHWLVTKRCRCGATIKYTSAQCAMCALLARRGEDRKANGAALIEHDPTVVLSRQQTRCLALIASGVSRKEAARIMGVSLKAVEFHMKNIHRRMRVRSDLQAARIAWVNGIGGDL